MNKAILVRSIILLLLTSGFDMTGVATASISAAAKSGGSGTEPDRVEVQHVLISFKGAIPDETVTRTQSEAEALAEDLFARAKANGNFDAFVKEYTDDQYPGIYRMSNKGIAPDKAKKEYSRERMVKAFGDVSFSLKVGEVGMARYDPAASKYGWHIIKRLK